MSDLCTKNVCPLSEEKCPLCKFVHLCANPIYLAQPAISAEGAVANPVSTFCPDAG